MITVDKNPAYPVAIQELEEEKSMPSGTQIRQQKYLNNIIEQDHRFIKKRVRSILGLKSFQTAKKILSGIEAMHMLRKKKIFLTGEICPKSDRVYTSIVWAYSMG